MNFAGVTWHEFRLTWKHVTRHCCLDAKTARNWMWQATGLTGELLVKPRISVLTLGVADLERSLAFYRDGLGLQTPGIVGREFEHGAVAFFDLSNGVKLAIWNQADLAHDSGLTKAPASSTSFSIGHNVSQRSEVDEVMEQAREAGAAIVKPAQETFYGGYAGYFTDPDGHLWEVVWNPANLPEETDLSPLP